MRLWNLDQLARLPEERAVQKHFDRLNYRTLRWVWRGSVAVAFGFFVQSSVDGDFVGVLATTLWFAMLGVMFFARKTPFYEENFPKILPAYLLATTAAMVAASPDPDFRLVVPTAFIPLLLLVFRMPVRQTLTLSAIFIALAITLGLATRGEARGPGEAIAAPVFINAIFAGASLFLSRQARRAFLEEWTSLAQRERERERMSDELDDARKIQLAMLPVSAPAVDWLAIAAASTPASEVGGDFYDYFLLDDGTVAIAIGDVAGHGVGSGLVLAGVKSGLHLLRQELREPVAVLERLNRLASEWLQWRMLVTLSIAIIDPRDGSVRVASAGHAPLLIISADGSSKRAGRHALPLGTKLVPTWAEERATLLDGDIIVYYTDGLTELVGASGESFGDERLELAVRDALASGTDVDAIRDAIIANHQSFRGGAPQLDDVSLVVARFRG